LSAACILRTLIPVLAIAVGAGAAQAGCEGSAKEERENCLHWANLNLDWSPQLKRRRDEIIARIGQHFYAWREYGEGFTVLGIIDNDSVKVKYDHHLSDNGIHALFTEFPSQEWVTKDPYAGKEGRDRRDVLLREFEKQCASGRPRIGMTQLQAYLEWCRPWTFHKTETARGVHEQWVYEPSPPHRYLYFDDGYLVGIQD
jgi:hypothetical protein